MQLFELFTQPVPWEWIHQSDELWTALFTAKDIDYQVTFSFEEYSQDYVTWEVEFASLSADVDNPYGITNTGNAYLIFSTVINIINDFKTTHNEPITVTAEELSRQKLYAAIVKKLSRQYKIHRFPHTNKVLFTVFQ